MNFTILNLIIEDMEEDLIFQMSSNEDELGPQSKTCRYDDNIIDKTGVSSVVASHYNRYS